MAGRVWNKRESPGGSSFSRGCQLPHLPRIHVPKVTWAFPVADNDSRDATEECLSHHFWPSGWNGTLTREDKFGLPHVGGRTVAWAPDEYSLFLVHNETADLDRLCVFERLVRCLPLAGGA